MTDEDIAEIVAEAFKEEEEKRRNPFVEMIKAVKEILR
jgi:hypothetical protein